MHAETRRRRVEPAPEPAPEAPPEAAEARRVEPRPEAPPERAETPEPTMGEPRSNQRGSTRPVQPRESSRSRSPPGRNYVTSREDIDDSMIVKPKTMDQACW